MVFFRILIICLVIACAYGLRQVVNVRNFYYQLQNPVAKFTIENPGNHSGVTIVEFISYGCDFCKKTHKVMREFAMKNPDIRYVVRPVPFSGEAETASEVAMVVGMQGKFWDIDQELTTHNGPYDEAFYKKIASQYDIPYEQMMHDAEGKRAQAMVNDNAAAFMMMHLESTPALVIGKTLYQPDKLLTLPDLIRMVQAEKADERLFKDPN